MSKKEVFVYAAWESDRKIGTIFRDVINGNEITSFEYEKEWISSHPQLLLDPTIPQTPYRSYPEDKLLFGAFEDSCPDRWGRRLIDRRESLRARREGRRPKKFFETDYLLGVQDAARIGGFRFKTGESGEFLGADELPIPPITSIRELEQISLGYESGEDDRWITRLVAPGSSLGGARPKATVLGEDGALWIAKFPSKNDDYDIGAWEKVVHDMAEDCGIRVPEARICHYNSLGSTYLSKRFDRNPETKARVHFASAMTMLGVRDHSTDGLGFLDLAEAVDRITAHPEPELRELYRRVIFDVAVSNQDDHLRNHGFLLEGEGWRLSPAYDINPVHNADFLSMNLDENDAYRSFEKVLETAPFYHIEKDEALEMIHRISSVVSDSWEERAAKCGIKQSERKFMSSAFSLTEEGRKL